MDKDNRFFIEIAYRGTQYHGWQVQANAHSIQGVLQEALRTLLRRPIELTGCGRTDTGVHAIQHFSHFNDISSGFEEPFIHQLNSILPEDISVKNIFPVHPSAHARFDPISRTYHYRIYFQKDPFLKGISTFCPYLPELGLMEKAGDVLKEYSDFSCFSKSHTQVKTHICTILKTEWIWDKGELVFIIEADRFLRNMVRAIVGTLLRIGWGEIDLNEFRSIIESGDRSRAGSSVSPDGLYLQKIQYPYPIPEPLRFYRKKNRNLPE